MYKADNLSRGFPDGMQILYVKNEDDVDWYDYLKGDNFEEGSVKAACFCVEDVWTIMAANYDATKLFPVNQMVIEIVDYEGKDPQKELGGKKYDPETNTICYQ
jgi:hypothetical protein